MDEKVVKICMQIHVTAGRMIKTNSKSLTYLLDQVESRALDTGKCRERRYEWDFSEEKKKKNSRILNKSVFLEKNIQKLCVTIYL